MASIAPFTVGKVLVVAAVAIEAYVLRGASALPIALTLMAAAAIIAWGIMAPRAQLIVPSVHRTNATDAVAFTFDDGPDPETTPRILDLLASHNARATFFVVGSRAAEHVAIVQRMASEGHTIATHTWSHAHTFHFGTAAKQRRDVERGIEAVLAITGDRPRFFRPPQGLRTPPLRAALRGLSVVCVTWTERALDAMGRDTAAIVRRLDPYICAGSIVTLHDGGGFGGTTDRKPTVDAVASLLDLARDRGLRCASLSELLS